MKLTFVSLFNYRLIREAKINLDTTGVATVFVGPNNSGKTAVAEGIRTFLRGVQRSFTFDDFSASTHADFDAFETAVLKNIALPELPSISMELRFTYSNSSEDLSAAEDLLMDLDDTKSEVVLRIDFCPRSIERMVEQFNLFHAASAEAHLAV